MKSTTERQLPNLDAVRGFAALAVFVNHVEWLRHASGRPNWNHLPFVYNCGMLGVNLFFVLSGFLITHLLLAEQAAHGRIAIGRFYARRILRIWPLYFAVTLLSFFLLPRWLGLPGLAAPLEAAESGKTLTLFLFMLPNIAYVTLPLVPFASLLWSVGVEEQFYAVWPWLLRSTRRWLPVALGLLVLALPVLRALAWRNYQATPAAEQLAHYHFLDFFRVSCLALGALAAWLAHAGPSRWLRLAFHPATQVGAALVAMGVHLFSRDLFGPVHTEVMAASHALLILNLALNPQCLFALRVPGLAYLGRVSYGFYLLHLPALALVLALLSGRLEGPGFTAVLYVGGALLALAFASASYFGFERTFLRWKVRFSPAAPKAPAARGGHMVLALLVLAPSLLWCALDETVWPWDPAWYGEVATDLWWTLSHHSVDWGAQMLAAFGTKAPGVSWLGQFFAPLGQAVGSVEFGLLCSVWLAALGALLLLARAGRALWQGDERGGWLAVLVAGTSPLFVGMSHQFMVESLQTLGVTYFYWLALVPGDRSRVSLCGHALLAGALALIAKVTSPLYCGLAVLIVVGRFVSAPRWQAQLAGARWRERALVAVGALALGSTVIWYVRNAEAIQDFVRLASSSEVALEYGRLPEFRAKWRFWLHALAGGLALPMTGAFLLAALAVAAVLALVRRRLAQSLDRWQAATVLAAALTIALTLFTFTRQINEETRYLLPLAPSLTVLVIALTGLLGRRLLFGLLAAACVVQAVVVNGAALRFWPRPVEANVWLLPYEPDKIRKRDLMGVVKRTTDPLRQGRIHVNTYEAPWLNANSLSFYAAKHRLRSGVRDYYTSLGYAATDLDAAWARVESIHAGSLIALEPIRQDPTPNFLNKIAVPALDRARLSPAYAPVEFPNRSGLLIYGRR